MGFDVQLILLALAPVFVGCIAWEMVWWHRRGDDTVYRWRDTLCNTGLALLHQGADKLAWLFVIPIYAWVYNHWRIHSFDSSWTSLVALFLVQDFLYYWFHRMSHRVRWLWAAHSVHHSSEHMNLSTAFRQSLMYPIAGMWLFWLPMAWLGFQPALIVAIVLLNLAFQFFVHTQAIPKLGPLERLLNTPSIHRVHHARNAKYIDRNYAGVLVIWDRLFGSYVEEDPTEPCDYGTVKRVVSFNPLTVTFSEWRGMFSETFHAKTWNDRIKLLFAPPEIAESVATARREELTVSNAQ
ncbi:sterol desaturase family protein [Neisseriaceae bacterium JH1-16]|nr:sterol desaturase family protein [Neisseriaceae bacterium JH1-16]